MLGRPRLGTQVATVLSMTTALVLLALIALIYGCNTSLEPTARGERREQLAQAVGRVSLVG